jgi:hypothetical protein
MVRKNRKVVSSREILENRLVKNILMEMKLLVFYQKVFFCLKKNPLLQLHSI